MSSVFRKIEAAIVVREKLSQSWGLPMFPM